MREAFWRAGRPMVTVTKQAPWAGGGRAEVQEPDLAGAVRAGVPYEGRGPELAKLARR